MLTFAITGGIACGKSLVSTFLQERDIPVCDTDAIAHKLLEPGQQPYSEVVRVFGESIVGPDSLIDRSILGRIVFEDSDQLAALNNIMHPAIKRQWRDWVQDRQDEGDSAVAVMIPLLFEVGADQGWDATISVISARALQVERLGKRGLTETEAVRRIDAQLPNEEKAARADYVLMNDGSREALKEQTFILLDRILERHDG